MQIPTYISGEDIQNLIGFKISDTMNRREQPEYHKYIQLSKWQKIDNLFWKIYISPLGSIWKERVRFTPCTMCGKYHSKMELKGSIPEWSTWYACFHGNEGAVQMDSLNQFQRRNQAESTEALVAELCMTQEECHKLIANTQSGNTQVVGV